MHQKSQGRALVSADEFLNFSEKSRCNPGQGRARHSPTSESMHMNTNTGISFSHENVVASSQRNLLCSLLDSTSSLGTIVSNENDECVISDSEHSPYLNHSCDVFEKINQVENNWENGEWLNRPDKYSYVEGVMITGEGMFSDALSLDEGSCNSIELNAFR